MEILLTRKDDAFHFEGIGSTGIPINIDAGENIGGHNLGARPMELLLMGLGGCTGIDVVLVLKKQKQTIHNFQIRVSGERETIEGTMKTPFKTINVQFEIEGEVDPNKALRAITMSMEKYCSATAQLEASAQISHSLLINGEKI